MEENRLCKLGECGKVLVRQPNETKKNFELREFCNKRCSGIWVNLQRKTRRPHHRQK